MAFLGAGCESGGSGGDFSATSGGSQATTPGTVTFLFAKAQAVQVPTATAQIRFEFLDGSRAVLETRVYPFAPSITVTPPQGTVAVRLTSLSEDGFPLAEINGAVPVPGTGQNIQVDASSYLFASITLNLFSVTPNVVNLAGGELPEPLSN